MEKNLAIKFVSIAKALGSVEGLPEVLAMAGKKLASVDSDENRRRIWSALLGENVEKVKYAKTIYTRLASRFLLTDVQSANISEASALRGGGKVAVADVVELEKWLAEIK